MSDQRQSDLQKKEYLDTLLEEYSADGTETDGGVRPREKPHSRLAGREAGTPAGNGWESRNRSARRREEPLREERAVPGGTGTEPQQGAASRTDAAPAPEETAAPPEKPLSPPRRAGDRPRRTDSPWRRFDRELRREWSVLIRALETFFVAWGDKFQRGSGLFHEIVRSKHNRGFPESTHFLVQLLLFVWGMIPYWVTRAREKFLHRRKLRIRRSSRFSQAVEDMRLHPAWFLAGAGAVAAAVIFFSLYTFGTHVIYDGSDLGFVSRAAVVEKACGEIQAATQQTLQQRYTLSDADFTCRTELVRRRQVQSLQQFENVLSADIGIVEQAYALYIDGELICATPYQYVLEDMLNQLQYAYTSKDTVSCSFEESVEVRQAYVPVSYVMDVGSIAELLNGTHQEEVTYTVQKGDVWSKIANGKGMTSAQLLKLNPGYNINSLHVGDTLVLSAAVPYLTITFTEQQHYMDTVPYQIQYKESASMYKGDYKVLSAGSYGSADVLADVTYTNGQEVSRAVLSSVTLVQPVTEIQAVGTKERPTWMPTGNFRWPASGHITSYYGYRSLWGRTNYHGGIDIANSRGTPIYAADGGTVTYAGWYSTYGYLVIINHGNGYETYYGHNSRLLVSVGDHVYKGQQIAKMGMTGNASGNHCHFEVRYNGARRNPLKYLP